MNKTLLSTIAATLLLGGCSLIPDDQSPASPVPQAWPKGPAYDSVAGQETSGDHLMGDLAWQDFFRSPQLRQVISLALENNRDLRVAALNIEASRASYQISRADLFPAVNADGSRTRSRTPKEVSATGRTQIGSEYGASLGVTSYEVDLFGRVHSLETQALEQFFATEDAKEATQISLVAEVANGYLTLLADRKLLELTQDTLASQQKSYDLVALKFNRGVASRLDVTQAKSSVDTAQANRALYTRQVAQDRNALELLVGTAVPTDVLSVDSIGTDDFVTNLPSGLPSDLLLRRPDIREAEHTLKAANAKIGAARAAFYPKIVLTGSAGTESAKLADLFMGSSMAWSFAPQISLPIFDGGTNEANLETAKVNRDIAVAQYEKAIQTAFREVADSLAASGTLGDQLQAQKSLVASTQESYQLSHTRYDKGIDSYLNVLDAQRALYSAQQNEISVELSRLTNLITLYKVLGGGTQESLATPD